MRVAILGTGKMGSAIARRLHGVGNDLAVWNRTRSRAQRLGFASVAETPAEAVADAEVVLSILTDEAAVRAAYLDPDGALKSARGQVFVEMSTAGPAIAAELEAAVRRSGARFIESPVMGTIGAMEAGKGLLMAAGDDDGFDRARPVLEAIGEVYRVDTAEEAAKIKLLANTMVMGYSALTAELMAAAAAAGVDPEHAFAIYNRMIPALAVRRAGYLEHRYEPVTFALRDAVKDLRLAADLYRAAHAWTPMAEKATELFERAVDTAGGLDISAISTLYEKKAAGRKA